MTRVKCPNCDNRFEIERKYDENFDTVEICPDCSWQVSIWGFSFDEETEEIDPADQKIPSDD